MEEPMYPGYDSRRTAKDHSLHKYHAPDPRAVHSPKTLEAVDISVNIFFHNNLKSHCFMEGSLDNFSLLLFRQLMEVYRHNRKHGSSG